MKFPSKVDSWLIPVMILSLAGLVAALVAVMIEETPWAVRALVVVAVIAVIFLLFSIFRNTYYVVADGNLRVVSGPLKWTIALSDITDIEPSHNLLSSPALSMDRLKVSYGKRKFILISPADKPGFLRAIEQASPGRQ